MEDKVSVWKANLSNGLLLGLIGVVYSLLMYFLDLTFDKRISYVFLVLLAVVLYFLIKSYRDSHLHGYITYGHSLGAGVVIFLYYSIITAIFTYILYKFIDSGLVSKQLAMTEELMVKKNIPQQAIDSAMVMQKKIMVPEFMAPISILGNMFFGTIIALIVSIFTRKEGNPLVDAPTN
ncbi:MAG: DUF4199 domain-containing protein [Bacteroidales bacterium]|jgi:hypothetical protein